MSYRSAADCIVVLLLKLCPINYDLLAEEAAKRVVGVDETQLAVEYDGLRNADRVGRCSAYACTSLTDRSTGSPRGARQEVRATLLVRWVNLQTWDSESITVKLVPGGTRANLIGHLEGTCHLVVAQYANSKPSAANSSVIRRGRAKCLHAIASVRDARITLIGLAPPKEGAAGLRYRFGRRFEGLLGVQRTRLHYLDDLFLGKLFEALRLHRGRKTDVSPDAAHYGVACAYGFQTRQDGFAELLNFA